MNEAALHNVVTQYLTPRSRIAFGTATATRERQLLTASAWTRPTGRGRHTWA